MPPTPTAPAVSATLDCRQCGSKLGFAPGERSLKCPHCGAANEIPDGDREAVAAALEELSFTDYLARQAGNEATIERQTVACNSCGAQAQLAEHRVADRCPFCAAPLLAAETQVRRLIRPRAIAPFEVPEAAAREAFRRWITGLWFAPNALKKAYRADRGLQGLYLPYWTYDADSATPYHGERGDYYYETETVTNQGRTETRQVRRTAWTPVRGEVHVHFDDVLVPASHTLPEGMAGGLAPWHLERLKPYRDEFVAGFSVEAYQLALEPGFAEARQEMEASIANAIRHDIGGDEQRIAGMSPQFANVSFKHVLLPVWLSSYRYGERSFRFLINGQTGAVQGERPYSAWKIAGAVLLALLVLLLVGTFMQGQ
jgi:predicted RNA-binding Zn-ribbon protein involved in translation (DUF1610 family)